MPPPQLEYNEVAIHRAWEDERLVPNRKEKEKKGEGVGHVE